MVLELYADVESKVVKELIKDTEVAFTSCITSNWTGQSDNYIGYSIDREIHVVEIILEIGLHFIVTVEKELYKAPMFEILAYCDNKIIDFMLERL